MKYLIIFLALFAVAQSQAQRRCISTPPIWSGAFTEVNYDAVGPETAFRFAYIDYDAINQRIHVREFERAANDRRGEVVEELFLFQSKTWYRVERGQPCEKRALTDEFRPFGVPPTATFVGIDYLGAEVTGLGVKVDQFYDRNGRDGGLYFASLAPIANLETQCVPVLEAYIRERAPIPERVNVHFTFLNITATVPPGAFNVPPSCQ